MCNVYFMYHSSNHIIHLHDVDVLNINKALHTLLKHALTK